MTAKTVKINGPAPKDGQVWRDTADGDLLMVVSDEAGIGSRVILLSTGDTIGYGLNEENSDKTPELLFYGPEEVEYVGMFWDVFQLREVSK